MHKNTVFDDVCDSVGSQQNLEAINQNAKSVFHHSSGMENSIAKDSLFIL